MERATFSRRLKWLIADVVDIVDETERVRSVVLSVPDWPGHLPGQHVDVRLTAEDGYQAVRSYSLASAPEDDYLMLTIERLEDGEVSSYLTESLQPGDRLELLGPIGEFFVWDARLGGPVLLIAGGSGIAPLMAMIRHRIATDSGIPMRLLYSSRSAEDIIYRSELARLSEMSAGVEIVQTLTRVHPSGWAGYARRVDLHMLREVVWPVEQNPLIYICGPTGFVESVAQGLLELGHPISRIRTERFGPTGP